MYKSEIDDGAQIDSPNVGNMQFKPMDGFGGNPLDRESWWMMTDNMALRAAHYGIFNDVEEFAKANDLYNFSLNLMRGTDVEKLAGTNYIARKAGLSKPLPKEVYAAKVLEENGHTVFFTPENKTRGMKNYDAIIDGRLGEFKNLNSFNQIRNRLNDADAQKAAIVCMEIPTANHTVEEAITVIRKWFNSRQKTIRYVDTVLLIWGGKVIPIKK